MITRELINRGGSKLEITRMIIESGLDIPVPVSCWRYAGQDLSSIRKQFDKMKKPVIVRGSHPNDYHGFIDVVPTKPDVYIWQDLETAVRNAEEFMQQSSVKAHCIDWNQPYTPEVHFLIQEQSPSPFVGSMIRHPGTRNIVIQYIHRKIYMEERGTVASAEFYPMGLIHDDEMGVKERELRALKRLYESLEASGLLEPSISYQVEFGLRPLIFFQARPFKPYYSLKKYDFLNFKSESHITAPEAFGVTENNGAEIHFEILDLRALRSHRVSSSDRYGIFSLEKPHLSVPIEATYGNLEVFCSACVCVEYLFHYSYRFLKKADISIIDFHYNGKGPDHSIDNKLYLADFVESKVFSDGKHALIVPAKYARDISF